MCVFSCYLNVNYDVRRCDKKKEYNKKKSIPLTKLVDSLTIDDTVSRNTLADTCFIKFRVNFLSDIIYIQIL